MTTLHLVRHAAAGDRHEFDGPDRRRPLSEKGHRQAERLADQLADAGITRLLSSPFLRCYQTLEPLAAKLGLDVEETEALNEGAGALPALQLAEDLRHEPVVFCSHGDVIPDILDELARRGVAFDDELRWQKASRWVVTWDRDRLYRARYVGPPPLV